MGNDVSHHHRDEGSSPTTHTPQHYGAQAYKFGAQIGKGGFAVVYKATRVDGVKFAIKKTKYVFKDLDNKEKSSIEKEIKF